MAGIVGINRLGSGLLAGFPPFPPRLSPTNRYLVDSGGTPILWIDYSFWGGGCVSSLADLASWIALFQSLGVRSVKLSAYVGGVVCTNTTPPNTVSADRDGNLPFKVNNDSSTYTSTWGGNADVSQPNDPYFNNLANVITMFEKAGMFVELFPFYLGFGSPNPGVQGLGLDLLNSGASKANTFAAYMAAKFPHPNIIWMAYGDHIPSGTLQTIHAGAWNTLLANATQRPLLVGGHYPSGNGCPTSPNNSDTDGTPAINSQINLNTIYHWNVASTAPDPNAYANPIAGCQQTGPVVATLTIDVSGYENSGAVGSYTPTATTVRTELWWSLTSSTAGVSWANAFTQYAGSTDGTNGSFTYANANNSTGIGSDGHKHLKIAWKVYASIPWWELLPANVSPMGTIVSSGGGTSGTTNWVTSAATSDGTVCVAYVPPAVGASASITIASGIMSKAYSAWWVDPTAGLDSAQLIGHFSIGAQSFTTPSGTNSYGDTDWVLLLRA